MKTRRAPDLALACAGFRFVARRTVGDAACLCEVGGAFGPSSARCAGRRWAVLTSRDSEQLSLTLPLRRGVPTVAPPAAVSGHVSCTVVAPGRMGATTHWIHTVVPGPVAVLFETPLTALLLVVVGPTVVTPPPT
jgi:hypothetical protein